jgi:hypothetical protein
MHAAGQLPIDRLADCDNNRHDTLVSQFVLRANPGSNTRYIADA